MCDAERCAGKLAVNGGEEVVDIGFRESDWCDGASLGRLACERSRLGMLLAILLATKVTKATFTQGCAAEAKSSRSLGVSAKECYRIVRMNEGLPRS